MTDHTAHDGAQALRHTPLPWCAGEGPEALRSIRIMGANGHCVADVYGAINWNAEDEANFIITAVNQHAALARKAAALDQCVKALEPFANFHQKWSAKPMSGIGDEFYSIQTGTEWEASLRKADLALAFSALTAARAAQTP